MRVCLNVTSHSEKKMVFEKWFPFWAASPMCVGKHPVPLKTPVDCVVWETARTRITGWLDELGMYDVRCAIGPPVVTATDWPEVRMVYQQTQARISEGVAVRTRSASAIRAVPQRYAICPDLQVGWDPWACIGRRVWLAGPLPFRRMWERYCELRTVGVEVIGIALPSLRAALTGQSIIGGDLRTHPVRGWFEDERLEASMKKLLDFWAAADKLYG